MKTLNVSGGIYFDQRDAMAQADFLRKAAVERVVRAAHDTLPHYEVVGLATNGTIVGWIVTEDA